MSIRDAYLHKMVYMRILESLLTSATHLKEQGVKAVISKSFERIHRSNLVGMGLIPLCFKQGEDADSLGLTGFERYTIEMPTDMKQIKPGMDVTVKTDNGKSFKCTLRFDTQVSCTSHRSDGG